MVVRLCLYVYERHVPLVSCSYKVISGKCEQVINKFVPKDKFIV